MRTRANYWIQALAVLSITLAGVAQAAQLEFGQAVVDGVDGVNDLGGVTSVAVSPDGRHVYAASQTDNAITIFSRNGSTGVLSFVEAQTEGGGFVSGLYGLSSVTVSPDGQHVYAAVYHENAIVVYSRNVSTGALTFIEAQVDNISGVNGLRGASSVTVSPDGQNVYAAGQRDDGIAVFSRNSSTGTLTFVESQIDGRAGVNGLDQADWVTVSPDGQHVYTTSKTVGGMIAVFSRNGTTGALTFVEAQTRGFANITQGNSVTVSPDGQHVYAAGFNDSTITFFSRNSSTGGLTFVEAYVDDASGVDGLAGVISLSVSPDGQHVYAASQIDDAIAVFSRNGSTGALTFIEAHVDDLAGVEGLDTATSVMVSPDGQHVYAGAFHDDAISVFSTAEFSFGEVQVEGVASAEGLDGVTDLLVSPDGLHVYTTGFSDNTVGVFALDEENSNLSFVEAERNNQGGVVSMNGPFNLAMSGDGRDLYVTVPFSSAIVHFSRASGTGELTFQETLADNSAGSGLAGAFSVTVSPDGAHVYVGLAAEKAVSVWSRNPISGALTFIEIQSELGGVVSGLATVVDLKVSPDGLDLYAAAADNSGAAGAHFFRNPTTGRLAFAGEIEGFGDGVSSVVVSRDGRFVYMADSLGILGYSRSQSSGVLSFFASGSTTDGEFGDLALSADGRHLLGVDRSESALFVWNRDGITGSLIRSQREFNGLAGVSGIGLPEAVAITPSGGHALVAGTGDDSLALFVPEPGATMGLGAGLVVIGLLAVRREKRACSFRLAG